MYVLIVRKQKTAHVGALGSRQSEECLTWVHLTKKQLAESCVAAMKEVRAASEGTHPRLHCCCGCVSVAIVVVLLLVVGCCIALRQ